MSIGGMDLQKEKNKTCWYSLCGLPRKNRVSIVRDLKELGGFKQKEAESFVSLDNTDARHHWSQKRREGNAEAGHGFKFPRHLDQFIL